MTDSPPLAADPAAGEMGRYDLFALVTGVEQRSDATAQEQEAAQHIRAALDADQTVFVWRPR